MKKIIPMLLIIVMLAGCMPVSNLYKRVKKHLVGSSKNNVQFKLPVDYDDTPVSYLDWVYIPAGEFLMGSSDADTERADNEIPQHMVYLNSYWISKTEITNAMFNTCVEAGVCKYSVSFKTNPHYLDSAYANHPVVYISWQTAQVFCKWLGGRLPTEAEWEKAARGVNDDEYPWGTGLPSLIFTNSNNLVGDTTPVKAFPQSISYYGVLDMGSNVREWVSDWYDPDYFKNSPYENPKGPDKTGLKVLKGASYLDPYRYTRAANRLAHKPSSPGAVRGFRCAMSSLSMASK
jgi:formylglycine-generating enzyme required for sulfatase activity